MPHVPELAGPEDDSNFGTMDTRGQPIAADLDYEYDVEQWDDFFDGY